MADRTTASITVAAPRADVMAVIADFAAYPEWASAVRSAEVIGHDGGGRARQVRFALDAGVIKDSYVLAYDWDGDAGVRWDLAEPGSVITALSGGYLLADSAAGNAEAQSGEDHNRHRAERAQGPGRSRERRRDVTEEPSRSGQDPIGDFQRWLVRSGARSVSREVSG